MTNQNTDPEDIFEDEVSEDELSSQSMIIKSNETEVTTQEVLTQIEAAKRKNEELEIEYGKCFTNFHQLIRSGCDLKKAYKSVLANFPNITESTRDALILEAMTEAKMRGQHHFETASSMRIHLETPDLPKAEQRKDESKSEFTEFNIKDKFIKNWLWYLGYSLGCFLILITVVYLAAAVGNLLKSKEEVADKQVANDLVVQQQELVQDDQLLQQEIKQPLTELTSQLDVQPQVLIKPELSPVQPELKQVEIPVVIPEVTRIPLPKISGIESPTKDLLFAIGDQTSVLGRVCYKISAFKIATEKGGLIPNGDLAEYWTIVDWANSQKDAPDLKKIREIQKRILAHWDCEITSELKVVSNQPINEKNKNNREVKKNEDKAVQAIVDQAILDLSARPPLVRP